jgi:hypothetical protein
MSVLREDPHVEEVVGEVVEIPEGMRLCSDGVLRPIGKQFEPGNEISKLGGRPKGLARRIRDMVGDDPARIANVLFDILEDTTANNADRIHAAKELFDRGWGKAPSYAPIEGSDPLEASELDRAIREIADQLVARRAHPVLDAKMYREEVADGVRPAP